MHKLKRFARVKKALANIVCAFIPFRRLRVWLRMRMVYGATLRALPKILTPQETAEALQRGRSIARFGEGEFEYILGGRDSQFQKYDPRLADKLAGILKRGSHGKLVVAIPGAAGRRHFLRYWNENLARVAPLLNFSAPYGDSQISREPGVRALHVREFRKIWGGRRVVFIGAPPPGDFYPDSCLYGNAKKHRLIATPPADAFDEYDRILKRAKKCPRGTLFVISAGFAATALAADLCAAGYQALDTGYLSINFKRVHGHAKRSKHLPRVKK